MPADEKQLTPKEQLDLLNIIQATFDRRVKKLRAEQYRLIAEALQRIDRKKAEDLLRALHI